MDFLDRKFHNHREVAGIKERRRETIEDGRETMDKLLVPEAAMRKWVICIAQWIYWIENSTMVREEEVVGLEVATIRGRRRER